MLGPQVDKSVNRVGVKVSVSTIIFFPFERNTVKYSVVMFSDMRYVMYIDIIFIVIKFSTS